MTYYEALQRTFDDPHDLFIEVCGVCGAQLDRHRLESTGRCAVSREHWKTGGLVLRVRARPLAEQHDDRLARLSGLWASG